MNLYNQEELDRIKKIKETNDKLEEFFNDKRTEWNKIDMVETGYYIKQF